jgi:hypothetical protein
MTRKNTVLQGLHGPEFFAAKFTGFNPRFDMLWVTVHLHPFHRRGLQRARRVELSKAGKCHGENGSEPVGDQ